MSRFKVSVNARRIEFGVGMIQHVDTINDESTGVKILTEFGFNFSEISVILNQKEASTAVVKTLQTTAHNRNKKKELPATTKQETATTTLEPQPEEPQPEEIKAEVKTKSKKITKV